MNKKHFEIIVCLSHFLISGSGGPKYKVLCANLMTPSEGLVHIGFYLMAVLDRLACELCIINFVIHTKGLL